MSSAEKKDEMTQEESTKKRKIEQDSSVQDAQESQSSSSEYIISFIQTYLVMFSIVYHLQSGTYFVMFLNRLVCFLL